MSKNISAKDEKSQLAVLAAPVNKIKACFGKKVGELPARDIVLNTVQRNLEFDDNATRTTKYTLLTFLPKALFEQYRRVANIYFTVVAALSLTAFSPVRPWTTWTPLIIVLGVSMIKEAIEDYKRWKADNEVNNRLVEVLNPETCTFEEQRWKDVRPGEVVMVKRDEFFPADLLFLSAESEEGTCYVETMNLDGETNLKIKKAPDETKDFTRESLHNFHGTVECEGPNARLYQFTGNLVTADGAKVSLSPSSILLRGSSLRNTERIFGAVIYAGHETKVFQNATDPPSKRSVIERKVDYIIFAMFGLNFAFCLTGCIYFAAWMYNNFTDHWYLRPSALSTQYDYSKPGQVGICNFITGFILYGYLIPISLYVSIEMVKITQSMVFIAQDRDMYHRETDTRALARTSNLNEELGMVTSVLSDKTGTLTRNMMDFFKCSIAGVSYGSGVTEIEISNATRRGQKLPEYDTAAAAPYRERFFNFYDARLMDGAWMQLPEAKTIEMFWRLLAVCHTVIPDGPQGEKGIKYEAESPDEAALVVAAKVMGFFFFKRTNTSVTVRERTPSGTADVEYEVLNVLEFTSTRKRMSVIVRDFRGKLIIFTKGADTVIYERLDNSFPGIAQLKERTTADMEHYGGAGLRTLCLAYNELQPDFYNEWQAKWVEAKTSLVERDAKMAAAAELIETNLRLLGCTAIEDKLQEGVPQCIKKLASAGIRLWVLTGDKMETAINIGFACSLITEEMQQFILTAYFREVDELEMAGDLEGAAKLANTKVEEQIDTMTACIQSNAGGASEYALVIDGKALSYALSPRLAQRFLQAALKCQAVVCCRVSPLQKAQVTALVKGHGDVTLAIGDGANDVGMIQQAHIGVGISGQEGMQAVMAADFAIAQFRFLTPLLLVHGRWSYKRIARMVNFFFYKNLLFGVTLFVFNPFTQFSGQYIYNDVYMTLFNVIFTALTPIIIGIFDRDLDKHAGLEYPQLYKQGQANTYMSFQAVLGWLGSSLFQCMVVLVLVLVGCLPTNIDRANGAPFTMYEVGILMFSVIILTVHLQVTSINEQWTWLHHLSIWGSQLVWWLFLIVYTYFPISLSADLYRLFIPIVGGCPQYWLYLPLVPVAAVLPDFYFRAVRRWLDPAPHEVVAEAMHSRSDGLPQQQFSHDGAIGANGAPSGNAGVVFKVFDNKASGQRQTGYVPPYDARSRFYNFIRSPKTAMAALGKAPEPRPDAVRNPVLAHLDSRPANTPDVVRGVTLTTPAPAALPPGQLPGPAVP